MIQSGNVQEWVAMIATLTMTTLNDTQGRLSKSGTLMDPSMDSLGVEEHYGFDEASSRNCPGVLWCVAPSARQTDREEDGCIFGNHLFYEGPGHSMGGTKNQMGFGLKVF